jgi:uncharacterized membrane protein
MTDVEQKEKTTRLIDGRLHSIHEIRDKAGELISHIATPLRVELKREDIAQLIAGAIMLGVPVALTEEVWVLGEMLPASRIWMIAVGSILINAFYVKMLFYRDNLAEYPFQFINRVLASYAAALLVALVLLTMFDMGPLQDPMLALRRAVIIAFPASFAAISVDYIR